MNLKRKIGGILECQIGGHATKLRRVPGHYDYANGDRARCPVCDGLGIPWSGLFHCEGGPHKAVVETGQCFEIDDEFDPDTPRSQCGASHAKS